MASAELSGSGFKARAGALTLLYAASSASRALLLRTLVENLLGREDGGEEDIQRAEGDGPGELSHLLEVTGDGDEELRVTSEGKELLYVSAVLKDWLGRSPRGRLRLGELSAGQALGALVFGWSATVIHAFSRGPRSLLELRRAVDTVSTEMLIERVGFMEENALVQARVDAGGKKRYAATRWLREGIAPLTAAARFERRFPVPDTLPPDSLDVSAAFSLAMPLVEVPADLTGTCRIGVEGTGGDPLETAGVTVAVEGGRVVGCEPGVETPADAFAMGSVLDWFDTLAEPELARVRTGGKAALAPTLLDALHETLFGAITVERA